MTQKLKDIQKAGPAGFSKVATRRQNQPKSVPANLKNNIDGDVESVLSQGTAKSSSSSSREEIEHLKRALAAINLEKQRIEQDNKNLVQDRETILTQSVQYRTQLREKEDQLQKMTDSMAKSPLGQTTTTTNTFKGSNVVTGHKTASFASPASSTFPQGGSTQPFSPFGNGLATGSTPNTNGSGINQVNSGFATPANQHTFSAAPTPFTHPPPPGYIWTQFVDTSGQILWTLATSPSPGQSSGNHSTNTNQSRSTLFTAPLGYITFDRKTWNVLTKSNVCNSDDLDDIKSWYDDLRSTFFSSTQGREVLPDLQQLHSGYNFNQTILPAVHQSNFQCAKNEFDAMSNSLRVLLTRDKTFEKCLNITDLVTIHKSSSCGFDFLMKILCDIFPHLGGDNLDVVDQINGLYISSEDSISTFLSKTVKLERKLDNTGQHYPPNSIVYKFIKELRRSPTIAITISPIFLAYNEHISEHGQNVTFSKTPYEIFKFLKKSGVDPFSPISIKGQPTSELTPTTCAARVSHNDSIPHYEKCEEEIVPSTNAAIVSSKKAPLYPPRRDTRHVKKPWNRTNKCKLCQKAHTHMECPHRGEEWSPIYIRQRVAKHNAMYPDEKPNPEYINQTPPLLAATTKSFAKKADVKVSSDQEDIFEDAVEELSDEDDDNRIEPEIKMADFDYDEYTVTSDGLVRY